MRLLSGDLSPYSAKIRMQIYAMDIADDFVFDLPLAEFVTGRLKDISPLGRIPILETEHGAIPESEVIAEYIDEMYPERSMLGQTPIERANVRVISRIGDTYLLNNIFLCLGQLATPDRNQGVIDLLMGQLLRGAVALEEHLPSQGYATGGEVLTRADCSLVPALYMCDRTVPRLGVANPIVGHPKTEAYWARIQENEHAARIIAEMDRGLKARLDGTEQQRVQEAMEAAAALTKR
ncbi:MAG: glutathione S-transferase family protein [Luminiphilus sp.]|nr:glutathione S-transferase family protein [Luminiphilus sp.]